MQVSNLHLQFAKNIYTIYPIWMCECDYTESAKEELKKSEQIPDERKQYYYKQLVINAQTGQIEPYLIKKQEPAYCPQIITWESLKWAQRVSKMRFASKKGDFATSLGEKENIM